MQEDTDSAGTMGGLGRGQSSHKMLCYWYGSPQGPADTEIGTYLKYCQEGCELIYLKEGTAAHH